MRAATGMYEHLSSGASMVQANLFSFLFYIKLMGYSAKIQHGGCSHCSKGVGELVGVMESRFHR